jgi:NAD(P)-dependent dehydrogenase (short-subunit alcohol dehydrogenase family)
MNFTRLSAAALGPQGIRCVTVSPAWTWSPPMEAMTDGDRDLADGAGADFHPLGRVGRMEEVANVVTFACSDKASWVTAATWRWMAASRPWVRTRVAAELLVRLLSEGICRRARSMDGV